MTCMENEFTIRVDKEVLSERWWAFVWPHGKHGWTTSDKKDDEIKSVEDEWEFGMWIVDGAWMDGAALDARGMTGIWPTGAINENE